LPRLVSIAADDARRAATRQRLIGQHVAEATADAWIAAWEVQADRDGLSRGSAYWEAGDRRGAAASVAAMTKTGLSSR
jgi:hypothetical protein